jgi:hypothetical protein
MLLVCSFRCFHGLGVQGAARQAEPHGRQVPGAGVHGDGGEGLRLQVPRDGGRGAERHDGELGAGPEDHLHPGGLPLRAGAVSGAGQPAPPRLPQGPPRRCILSFSETQLE